jgi:hypothetical protein
VSSTKSLPYTQSVLTTYLRTALPTGIMAQANSQRLTDCLQGTQDEVPLIQNMPAVANRAALELQINRVREGSNTNNQQTATLFAQCLAQIEQAQAQLRVQIEEGQVRLRAQIEQEQAQLGGQIAELRGDIVQLQGQAGRDQNK